MEKPHASPAARFERVTRIAARLFGAPVAVVSLHDGTDPQQGLSEHEARQLAVFVEDVLRQDEVLVLPDSGAAGFRFLAGIPIVERGVKLGALCVADHAARDFGDEERVLLRDVAGMAETELGAARLAHAAERKRAYFRTAAHELRTPMASILGFSELLLKREFDAATGRELLDIIHKQSSRLVAVVNQMLDLARIEAGGADETRRAGIALAGLARDALAAAVPAARAADVALSEAPGTPAVRVNPLRLQQALSNILSNAARFSTAGSRIEVMLAPATRDGRPGASVAIRDGGIGMTAPQQARMFESFYRTGDKPELEGAGLGLVLVREIVACHGGAIDVVSAPGAGTTVTIWIPAAA